MMPSIERKPPISDQVRKLLRERIDAGDYAPENRLPAEEQLARELHVSRSTIRTALASLAAEGLLIRRQGDGTYINSGRIQVQTRIETLWEFTRMIEESGRRPSIQALALDYRLPTAAEARSLHLAPGETVAALVRVFYADQQPVIYSTNTLPQARLCFEPSQADLQRSIFEFIADHCEQTLTYAVADLSAVLADEKIAAILNVPPGAALLQFEEVFYDRIGHPLVHTTNYYNDKLLRLKIVRSKS